jgi:guanine deaminase
MSTSEVWEMACLDGARLLGFSGRLGRIAPGYHADIVFLEARHLNWMPLNNAVNQLVHSEDGTAVHSVMVGGRMVVSDRRLLTIDMDLLAARTEAARARLEALNHDNHALFDELAQIVNNFCPAIARQPFPINRFGACADPVFTQPPM